MSTEHTKEEFYGPDYGDEDNPYSAEKRFAEAVAICEVKRLGKEVRIADWYLDTLRGTIAGGSSRREPGYIFSEMEDLLAKVAKGETFPIWELGYAKHGVFRNASAKRLLKAVKDGYEAWVTINKNTSMFGTITRDIYLLPLRAVEVVG